MAAFSHIACCVDDTDAARAALEHAQALRALAGGRLSVLHVVAPAPFLVSMAASLGGAPVHDAEAERAAAEMWIQEVAAGVPESEPVVLEGHPGEAACDWARDNGVDAMVAATHGGRVERALPGSFASFITQHAPCPVLLVPPALADR